MQENEASPSSETGATTVNLDKDSPTNPNAPTDEDRMHEMTASYSEISFDSQKTPSGEAICKTLERPDHLDLQSGEQYVEDLEGTVTREGEMVNFVAEDLEFKIKLASPVAKTVDSPFYQGSRCSTPSLYRQALAPQLPSLDPSILNDLEAEARRVASSVDTLTESLAGILRSVSALTVECLEIYRDAVCKTCDAVDSNIKAMYQLMAKCEELSKAMKPLYHLSDSIDCSQAEESAMPMAPPNYPKNLMDIDGNGSSKEMKRLLDLFENAVNS